MCRNWKDVLVSLVNSSSFHGNGECTCTSDMVEHTLWAKQWAQSQNFHHAASWITSPALLSWKPVVAILLWWIHPPMKTMDSCLLTHRPQNSSCTLSSSTATQCASKPLCQYYHGSRKVFKSQPGKSPVHCACCAGTRTRPEGKGEQLRGGEQDSFSQQQCQLALTGRNHSPRSKTESP